jgi:hypothetical protein
MFSVTDILTDPDFSGEFMLVHSTGSFTGNGVWAVTEMDVENVVGIILPARLSDLDTLPEGERNKDTIKCYSNTELTIGDQETKQADLIFWNGQYYRVAFQKYYQQVDVYMALAVLFQRVAS